jgi:pyrroline-5-carboxylate reductase
MTIIYLEDIKVEQDVLDVLPDLENEVIEAITAVSGKRQKISSAEMQVQQLMKKCGINKWLTAKKQIDRMFNALSREAKEYTANMWSL